jgi:hypothetical protein
MTSSAALKDLISYGNFKSQLANPDDVVGIGIPVRPALNATTGA